MQYETEDLFQNKNNTTNNIWQSFFIRRGKSRSNENAVRAEHLGSGRDAEKKSLCFSKPLSKHIRVTAQWWKNLNTAALKIAIATTTNDSKPDKLMSRLAQFIIVTA